MIKDYLKLSYNSLFHRGLRSWLTIIGIFIGIAAIVSLVSLGQGLRAAVSSQFGFLNINVLTVQASGLNYGPPGSTVVNPLKESYVQGIEGISGVDLVIGRIIEDGILEFNKRSDSTYIGSMPSGSKRKEVEIIGQFEIQDGRMLRDSDTNAIVLGADFKDKDRAGGAIETGRTVKIQGKEFEVVGIMKKKGSFLVDSIILINEEQMKRLFGVNDTYNVIAIKVSEGISMSSVKEKIEDYLRKERSVKKGEEDFTVDSPEQALKNVNSILFSIQLFVYIIAGISIVVGGIGIANSMHTSVTERTKQIGIMKSVGATNFHIFSLFVMESGLLGLIGGIMGLAIGLGLAEGLVLIGKVALNSELININLNPYLIFGSLIFSFFVGSVSGVVPALHASKLKPVDALRYKK